MAAKRPPRTSPAVDLAASPVDGLEPIRVRPDAGAPEQQGPTLGDGQEGVLVDDGPLDPSDLYVSCVPAKGPVTRFGAGNTAFIGARRDAQAETGVTYQPDAVVKIPGADARRFAREYSRVLAEGALVKRSREQYLAWKQRRAAELTRAKAEREAARAAVAKEAEAAAEQPATDTKPAAPAAGSEGPPAPPPADSSTSGD